MQTATAPLLHTQEPQRHPEPAEGRAGAQGVVDDDRPSADIRPDHGWHRTPIGQMVPEGFVGYTPSVGVPAYEVEGARKLLAEPDLPDGFTVTLHAPKSRHQNDTKSLPAASQLWAQGDLTSSVATDVHLPPAQSGDGFPVIVARPMVAPTSRDRGRAGSTSAAAPMNWRRSWRAGVMRSSCRICTGEAIWAACSTNICARSKTAPTALAE